MATVGLPRHPAPAPPRSPLLGQCKSFSHPIAVGTNAPAVPGAIARMGRALGARDVPAAVFDLAVRIGAPTSLAAIGMDADDLDEAARLIVEAIPRNPQPVTFPTIRALLDDAFEGRRPSLDRTAKRTVPA